MGAYINPEKETKEEFLHREGRRIGSMEACQHEDFEKDLLVILVDNGMFTAAAIAFDIQERDEFCGPDHRRRQYYLVPKEKLVDNSNLRQYVK